MVYSALSSASSDAALGSPYGDTIVFLVPTGLCFGSVFGLVMLRNDRVNELRGRDAPRRHNEAVLQERLREGTRSLFDQLRLLCLAEEWHEPMVAGCLLVHLALELVPPE